MAIGRLSVNICNNEPILKVQCKIQDIEGMLRIHQLKFNTKHVISETSFIVIDKITSQGDAAYIDKLLLTREAYWTAQLCTLNPHGLNKRREFRSKNRVRYNT